MIKSVLEHLQSLARPAIVKANLKDKSIQVIA